MGRTGIRSKGPGNLFADFYNKICQLRSLAAHEFNETSSAAPEAPLVAFGSLVPSCW